MKFKFLQRLWDPHKRGRLELSETGLGGRAPVPRIDSHSDSTQFCFFKHLLTYKLPNGNNKSS